MIIVLKQLISRTSDQNQAQEVMDRAYLFCFKKKSPLSFAVSGRAEAGSATMDFF